MTIGARGRGLLLAIALAASLLGGASAARAEPSAQGCTAHAVVAVEPGPGPVVICFDGSITGLQALELAGANPVTYGFAGQGGAVCQLNGVGNPADSSCLLGPGGQYWAYYRAAPGASGWTYSRAGATSTTVVDGSVEGWRYGTGAAPGFVAYCSMVACAPPATDPPPSTATPPPAPPTAAPPAGGLSSGPPAETAPTTAKRSTKDSGATAKGGDDTSATGDDDAASSGAASASTGSERATAARRKQADAVEVAAGGGSGGSGGGSSPLGVIVALALVAAGVGGGLWLRRHRRGAAPG